MQHSDNPDQERTPQDTSPKMHGSIDKQKQQALAAIDSIAGKLHSKSSLIAAGAGAGLLLIISVFLVSYFTVFRVPDDEYTKASTIVQEISTHAKKMAAFDEDLISINTLGALDEARIASAKTAADSYVNLLLQLQDSPVIKKDKHIKDVYARNKKVIDEYGTSSVSLLETINVYSAVTKKCSELSKRIDEPKTVAQFDALAAGCKEYAANHKTVRIKAFNDEVYVKYRKAVLDFVTAARKYYVASNSRSRSSVQRAMTTMDNAQMALQKVGAGGDKYLVNSPNSSDQLSMLREEIEERKEMWLR